MHLARRSSEYYFSTENLEADIFLRQQMSKDGFVPLSLIASFNRVQTLCDELNFIAEVRSHETRHSDTPRSLPRLSRIV